MIGEFNIFGVFIPAVLAYTLLSLAILAVLRRILTWTRLYTLLWHRALVDFCLLIIILAAVTAAAPRWIS